MDKEHIVNLIEESIDLELGAASLYGIFSELLPEDADLWRQLHVEEKSHAMLLRTAGDSFVRREHFPQGLLATSMDELRKANAKIKAVIGQCRAAPPSRTEACEIALALEIEAGETHYNHFMEKEPDCAFESVLQQLNRSDKDHATRIRSYLENLPTEARPGNAGQ